MKRKGWLSRGMVSVLIGVMAACGIRPDPLPIASPSTGSPLPKHSPAVSPRTSSSPTPTISSACRLGEAAVESFGPIDPSGWRWEALPLQGASLRRLVPAGNYPLVPGGRSAEGRFLDLWGAAWYGQSCRSLRLTVDLEGERHRRWPETFSFCFAPGYLRWYLPRSHPTRSPEGRWMAATEGGRVVAWRPGEPVEDLQAPKPMIWAGWGGEGLLLALDREGQVWRGAAGGGRWEPVRDPEGQPLRAAQIAVGPESPWAVAMQFESGLPPRPTSTPRPLRAEPSGRTPRPAGRTPAPPPPDVPERVALWRVPFRWGVPAEGPARYERVVIGSDMPRRGSVLVRGGRWLLDDFPIAFPGTPFGTLGLMVEVGSGRILSGEELGWPAGEAPGDWELSPDGQWVAAAIIERATGRRVGIWVGPTSGFPTEAGWRFPGWEGVLPTGWHPEGKGVLVWRGEPGREQIGWLPLPPDPKGVRVLEGLAPWPIGWWGESLIGVVQGQPSRVVEMEREGRTIRILDLSPWVAEVVWMEATKDRLLLTGTWEEAEGCRYQLLEWKPR